MHMYRGATNITEAIQATTLILGIFLWFLGLTEAGLSRIKQKQQRKTRYATIKKFKNTSGVKEVELTTFLN